MSTELPGQQLSCVLHHEHSRLEGRDIESRPGNQGVTGIVAQVVFRNRASESCTRRTRSQDIDLLMRKSESLAKLAWRHSSKVEFQGGDPDVVEVCAVALQCTVSSAGFADLYVNSPNNLELRVARKPTTHASGTGEQINDRELTRTHYE